MEDAGTVFAKTRHAVELLGARRGGTHFEGTAVAGHGGLCVADLQGAGLERVAGAGLAVDAVGEVDFRQNLEHVGEEAGQVTVVEMEWRVDWQLKSSLGRK